MKLGADCGPVTGNSELIPDQKSAWRRLVAHATPTKETT